MSKLAVVIPCNMAMVPKTFIQTLWHSDIPKDAKLWMVEANSAPIARNKAIKVGLEEGIEEFLFFDADQTFPEEIYEHLHSADKDIISGFVAMTNWPHPYCVWKKTDDGQDATVVPMGEPRAIEVDKVGGGCLLVKADVFRKIEPPWFPMSISDDGASLKATADISFVAKAQEAGYTIYAHTGVFPGHLKTILLDRNYVNMCQTEIIAKRAAEERMNRRIHVPA